MNANYPQSSLSNDSRLAKRASAESKGLSRRDFLATCAGTTALLGLPVSAIGQASAENGVAEFGRSDGLNREIKNREELAMATDPDVFRPGETVPVSGIYDVIHDRLDGQEHALPHQVTAIAGKEFPPCRACHAWVRYRLYLAAKHMEADDHFK